jgi:hypothetical protein
MGSRTVILQRIDSDLTVRRCPEAPRSLRETVQMRALADTRRVNRAFAFEKPGHCALCASFTGQMSAV